MLGCRHLSAPDQIQATDPRHLKLLLKYLHPYIYHPVQMQIHRSAGYRRYLPDLAVSDPRKQYGNRRWNGSGSVIVPFGFGSADKNAIALEFPTSHTPTQLMQLCQTEALRILHHHYCGIGNIDAYFNYRGGD